VLASRCAKCSRQLYANVRIIHGDDERYCDNCFICANCRVRYPYCEEDPPPLNLCEQCLGTEGEV
jgi:hypothetical protein